MTDMVDLRVATPPRQRLMLIGFLPPALALFACAPLVLGQYGLSVALSLCTSIALAESWVLLSGLTGYISLGHAVFYGLGAYIMAAGWESLPFWAMIPLAGLASVILAAALGFPALNVRGPYFVILTFGIAELGKFVVVTVESELGNFGRIMMGAPDVPVIYEIMLAFAGISFAAVWFVQRSRFGAALRAIKEDEVAAETIGISVRRMKVAAYALSAIIPGMAGAVMSMRSAYFEPMIAFSPLVSFTIVTTAMIGGSSTPMGPVLGAVFLVGASEILWSHSPEYYNILLGVVLVIFVLRIPEGIHGRLAGLWTERQRRRAP
jgi:branched-chain amino acid transport system permease protein